MLRSVRSLSLCINHDGRGKFRPSDSGIGMDMDDSDYVKKNLDYELEPFFRLRALPVKTVTVTTSDIGARAQSEAHESACAAMVAYGRQMRADILDTEGRSHVESEEGARKAKEREQAKFDTFRLAEECKLDVEFIKRLQQEDHKAATHAERKTAKAHKNLDLARNKTEAEIAVLQSRYELLKKQSDDARRLANNRKEFVQRRQAIADAQSEKAERAKVRFEGRKPEKVMKRMPKYDFRADEEDQDQEESRPDQGTVEEEWWKTGVYEGEEYWEQFVEWGE